MRSSTSVVAHFCVRHLSFCCRSWYIAVATIQKDIVIAIDLSAGMQRFLAIAKILAHLLVATTQPNDNVSCY